VVRVVKSVSKLVPKVPVPGLPAVPGVSRRAQYSASTKKSLLEVALGLFTEHGYANASLDQIVAGAQVTKGALYHHFSGKQALFEAVFTEVEDSTARVIRAAVKGEKDPWERARIGLRTFLAVVQEPSYRRIVIQDGPAVLGYERFREREERSAYSVVMEIMQGLLEAADEAIDPEMVSTFAQIVFGALSSAGESVAAASDPIAAAARVELALGLLLSGVQSLADQGLKISDLEQPRPAAD
jgi:AcrR family transcriptional regulator